MKQLNQFFARKRENGGYFMQPVIKSSINDNSDVYGDTNSNNNHSDVYGNSINSNSDVYGDSDSNNCCEYIATAEYINLEIWALQLMQLQSTAYPLHR